MHLTLTISGDLRAPMAARRAMAAFEDHVSAATLEIASLVVNELVTNALLHACMEGEPIEVEVRTDGRKLLGHVGDPGRGFEPPSGRLELDALSGRGLILVDQLSSRWGVQADPTTRVWFEIDPGRSGAEVRPSRAASG